MARPSKPALLASALLALTPIAARAQDRPDAPRPDVEPDSQPDPQPDPELAEQQPDLDEAEPIPPLFCWVTGGAEYTSPSDFDAFDGEVEIYRLREQFGLRYAINPEQEQAILTTFTAEQSFYEFSGDVGFEAGTDEPWSEVRQYSLFALYSEAYSEDIRFFAGGSLDSSGERGADFDGTLTYTAIAGVSFRIAEGLRIGPGIAVAKRIEDGFAFVPIPILEWLIDEHWRLETAEAGLALKYTPVDEWTFSLTGQYNRRQYRLSDEGPAANAVVTEQRYPILAGVEWNPDQSLRVALQAGAGLFTRYELSRPGIEVSSDSGESFIIGFEVQVRF